MAFSPPAPGASSVGPSGRERTGTSVAAEPLFATGRSAGTPTRRPKTPARAREPSTASEPGFFLSLLGATDVVAINVWENCSLASDLEKANKK